MSKEQSTVILNQHVEHSADHVGGTALIDHLIAVTAPRPATDAVITQVLENVVGFLDSARRDLESTNRKGGYDVRERIGNSMATTLLAGVEEVVTYNDLVKLVDDMRLGLARRRVTLAEA